MSYSWDLSSSGTLKVSKPGDSNPYSFAGVTSNYASRTPESYFDAAVHMLAIGGLSAIIQDIRIDAKVKGVEE